MPTYDEPRDEPSPRGNGEVVRSWVEVPDHGRIARRAEILAAYDAWMVERQTVADRLGMDAAVEGEEDAAAALHEVEVAILATVPATAAGLVAKARWATCPGLPMALAAIWSARIAADVVAMAECGGVTS